MDHKKSGKNTGANASRVVSSQSHRGKKEYRNGTFIEESHEDLEKTNDIKTDQKNTIDVKIENENHMLNKKNKSKSVVEI